MYRSSDKTPACKTPHNATTNNAVMKAQAEPTHPAAFAAHFKQVTNRGVSLLLCQASTSTQFLSNYKHLDASGLLASPATHR